MKYLLLSLFLAWYSPLTAQTDSTTFYATSPVYLQVGLGLLPSPDAFNTEFSATIGYRFNRRLGLGVEYRRTSTHNESFGDNGKLLGLHLRSQGSKGWLTSLGGGIVLSASQGSDGFDSYTYRSGGYYLAADIGYQFRWGLVLGLYTTAVLETTHDHIRYNNDNDTYERTGNISTHSFVSFGPKISYAFPGRGNR